MTLLAIGLSLFVGVHLVPVVPPLRRHLVARVGADAYRGAFSLVALAGLGLVVVGKMHAPRVEVYAPSSWGPGFAKGVMPVAFVLLAASYLPCNIRRVVRHPMVASLILWSLSHLAANGDAASLVLFGGLGAYALVDLASHAFRESATPKPAHARADLAALVLGALLYMGALQVHAALGRPVP